MENRTPFLQSERVSLKSNSLYKRNAFKIKTFSSKEKGHLKILSEENTFEDQDQRSTPEVKTFPFNEKKTFKENKHINHALNREDWTFKSKI